MTDYQVCARAVRTPLRRWFRRTGIWWLVAAGFGILIAILKTIILTCFDPTEIHRFLLPLVNTLFWLGPLELTIIPLLTIHWLLAVRTINTAIDKLISELPDVPDPNWSILSRFHLSLRTAILPLLLIALYLCNNRFHISSSSFDLMLFSDSWLNALDTGIISTIIIAAAICLIAGLAVQLPPARPLAWLWWAGPFCFAGLTALRWQTQLPLIGQLHWPEVEQDEPSGPVLMLFALTGFLIIITALRLLASKRTKTGLWLTWAIGAVSILGALNLGMASGYVKPCFVIRYRTDVILAYVYRLDFFFRELAGNLETLSGESDTLHPAMLVVPVAVLAASYYAVRWAITHRQTAM